MHPGGIRCDTHLFYFEKSANLKHPSDHLLKQLEFLYLYFFYLQEEDWAGSLNHLLDCTGGDGGHVDDQ